MGPNETTRVDGLSLASGSMDLKMKGVVGSEVGLEAGPSYRADDVGCLAKGSASPKVQSSSKGPTYAKGCLNQPDLDGKLREGPISPVAQVPNKDPQEKNFLLKYCISSNGNPPETKSFVAQESEDTRKQQGVARLSEIDRAFEEESLRYGMGSCSWGKRALGASHLNSILFYRTPGGGGFYDRSGDWTRKYRLIRLCG